MKKGNLDQSSEDNSSGIKRRKNHSHNNRLQTEDKTRQNLREMWRGI